MKRFCLKVISVLAIALVLFYGVVFVQIYTPTAALDESYQQGFLYQYRAAEREESPKILSIGASNVAFNINTELLSERTGMPAYNLGVNGGMGISYIFECAERLVQEGDIVVFPVWEFQPNDHGMELIWTTIDGEKDMVSDLLYSHPLTALATVGSISVRSLYAVTLGKVIGSLEGEGYTADAFDKETGNYIYERGVILSEEAMNATHLEFSADKLNKDFVRYVNEFTDRCAKRGVRVYLSFHSVSRNSLYRTVGRQEAPATDEDLLAYEEAVKEQFNAPLVTSFLSVLFEWDQYFNMPTHLNSVGMNRYTEILAEDLNRALSVGAV